MRPDHYAKRKQDRDRARAWLSEDAGRLPLVLRVVFKDEQGDLKRLHQLVPHQPRLAQGIAAILVGERYAHPVQADQGRYDHQGRMVLGIVKATRKAAPFLQDSKFPKETGSGFGRGRETDV